MNRATTKPPFHEHIHQRGLTLIEIMIAMTLSVILLMGVTQIFVGSKTTYNLQKGLSRVQENGRFAINFLHSELRMAGFSGCSQNTPYTSTLNPSGTNYVDYGVGIEGYTSSSVPTGLLATGVEPVTGTDVVVLRYAKPTGMYLTQGMPNTSASMHVQPIDPPPFEADDILTVTDCSHSTVFQATSYNSGGSGNLVVHNTGNSDPGNSTKDLGHTYSEGAEILKMVSAVYYIDENADGVRSLYRREVGETAQELVRGVESMQLQYGVDTNEDEAADVYQKTSAVTDWGNVMSVRAAVLVGSIEPAMTEDDTNTYTLLDTSVDPADTRELRHVFTSTITLRNRALQ